MDPKRVRARTALLVPLLLLLTGCSREDIPNFGWPHAITPQGQRALDLWKGSSVAGLVVMIAVYGLMFWAAWAYRKRDDVVPAQVGYNLPVEVLYTVIPTIIVAFLFYFTARDESYIDKLDAKPDCTVNIVGFQWAWQYNYTDCGTATGLSIIGRPGRTAAEGGELSHLILPEGKVIRFVETSPDVIHSWWVPDLLFKRDVVPGRQNTFQVDSIKAGTYKGRCAELCGEFHSRMLFTLTVAPQSEFDAMIAAAKADTTSGRYTVNGSNQ
ncbi:MAG: cytochrome c oxidase subunit [Frankiaceae bacterium]|nr:cytochrome c oxidase subunit [Frankiaceae bacterium]MDX6273892.1 cytochrome c oxidase subunit [Frankiales bacterium]